MARSPLARPLAAALLAAGVLAGLPQTAAAVDKIVVTDTAIDGIAGDGGLISVNLGTGARASFTENDDPAGGPDLVSPNALAFEADGDIVVTDSYGPDPQVVRVSRFTGARTVVSDNATPNGGPALVRPTGIAVEADGSLLVTDATAFANGNGGVLRIDPATGVRTTVSRMGAPAGTPNLDYASGLALEPDGDILVTDDVFPNGGKVVRVDPQTGTRTLVSRNTSPVGGTDFVSPEGVATDAAGDILITDGQLGGWGGVTRVDPATGARTTVTHNNDPVGGAFFQAVDQLAVEASGDIVVTDHYVGSIVRVDPVTGVRTTLSDNGAPAGGPGFGLPRGIAIGPVSRINVSTTPYQGPLPVPVSP